MKAITRMKERKVAGVFALLVAGAWTLGFADSVWAEHVDPDNDGSQYAYAANLGWINAEPLGDGGPGVLVQADALTGWLWSANTGWISLSCENTASCGNVDYRVTVDDAGALSGYAWSPNIGWISFSCVDSATCGNVNYAVEVDLFSGEMSGFAYAANTGWISFSCVDTATCGNVDFGVRLDPEAFDSDGVFMDGFESG